MTRQRPRWRVFAFGIVFVEQFSLEPTAYLLRMQQKNILSKNLKEGANYTIC